MLARLNNLKAKGFYRDATTTSFSDVCQLRKLDYFACSRAVRFLTFKRCQILRHFAYVVYFPSSRLPHGSVVALWVLQVHSSEASRPRYHAV